MEKEETWGELEVHTRKYSRNDWLFFQLIGFTVVLFIVYVAVLKKFGIDLL